MTTPNPLEAAIERVRAWSEPTVDAPTQHASDLRAILHALEERTKALETPELHDFAKGVALEGAHQRQRWGAEHDAGKAPADWFWLVGYLAQKALMAHIAGDADKAMHHTISTAAALANWHAAISGADTSMRPGIDALTALGGSEP